MPKAILPKSRPLTIAAEPGLRFMRLGRGGALEIASSPRVEILIEDAAAFLNELLRALASPEGTARLAIEASTLSLAPDAQMIASDGGRSGTGSGTGQDARTGAENGDLRLSLELAPGRRLDLQVPARTAGLLRHCLGGERDAHGDPAGAATKPVDQAR